MCTTHQGQALASPWWCSIRDPYAYEGNGYEAPAPAYGGAGGAAYDRTAYERAAPPAYGAPAAGYDRAGYAPERCRHSASQPRVFRKSCAHSADSAKKHAVPSKTRVKSWLHRMEVRSGCLLRHSMTADCPGPAGTRPSAALRTAARLAARQARPTAAPCTVARPGGRTGALPRS